MRKEINSLLNLYLEVDSSVLVENNNSEIENLKTGVVDNASSVAYDFLYELIEANPEILKNMDSKK